MQAAAGGGGSRTQARAASGGAIQVDWRFTCNHLRSCRARGSRDPQQTPAARSALPHIRLACPLPSPPRRTGTENEQVLRVKQGQLSSDHTPFCGRPKPKGTSR